VMCHLMFGIVAAGRRSDPETHHVGGQEKPKNWIKTRTATVAACPKIEILISAVSKCRPNVPHCSADRTKPASGEIAACSRMILQVAHVLNNSRRTQGSNSNVAGNNPVEESKMQAKLRVMRKETL